ncbi:MAG: SRPBCC family protein [Bacteroidota bacterium]|nr:SRPBCC family protein [Bacteroidota bacterium]
MVDVLTEILISKPVLEKVSEYAGNPDNAPEWYVNIKSAEWKTPGPLTTGSKIAFVANFLGRKLSYTYEITEFIRGQKLVMRTAEGPFPMETTYTWTAIDSRTTKMTLRNRGYPTGFSKLVAPLMAKMMRKANTKDLANIKKIIEGR